MALDYDGDFAIVWTGYNASGTRSDVYGRRFDSQAQNRPPVTVDDRYTTRQNQPLTVPAPGVLGNDSDPDGHSLTATLYAAPDHGQVTLHPNGSFTYTPDPGWDSVDYFTYTASDGTATSRITTVEIRITTNLPPVAKDDLFDTDPGVTLTVNAPGVLLNDRDDGGPPSTAVLLSRPAQGTLQFNSNGSFRYIPASNFRGSVRFTYKANDGATDSNVATVTIRVGGPRADMAVSQSVSGRPEAGRTNVYTIVVRNNGPNPATDTRLLQTFSGARPRIESVRTSRGRCFPQPGSSYFQCEFETLQRGQAAIVRVSVTYGLVGPTSSHAVVGADEPDPNERNNASLVRRTIRFPIER